jgi:hypothetical protein
MTILCFETRFGPGSAALRGEVLVLVHDSLSSGQKTGYVLRQEIFNCGLNYAILTMNTAAVSRESPLFYLIFCS